MSQNLSPKRVFMLGATGTIGRATVAALLDRGHHVTCFMRRRSGAAERRDLPPAADLRFGDVTDPMSLRRDGFGNDRFDVLVSCMASRSGTPKDAWAIDHKAHVDAVSAAKKAGVEQVILLSAICVQRPRLAFQQAKLAAEAAVIDSGLTYAIVRPTAFFKSLSGQLDRLRNGKPFLLFGDGCLTACKPISDADLASFLAGCIEEPGRHNRILPIGGPGPAVTPRAQAEILFRLLGREPQFRHVPIALMDAIIAGLSLGGRVSAKLSEKAELARIGRYYATESMLLFDPETGVYDADATPSFGTETLADFYERLVRGDVSVDRGDHAVF